MDTDVGGETRSKKRRIFAWLLVCYIVAMAVAAVILSALGLSVLQIMVLVAIAAIFLVIPTITVLRSVEAPEPDTQPRALRRRMFVLRIVVFFVLSPAAFAVVVLLTYPNVYLSVPLGLVTLLAASAFFFLTK